jgi:phosphomethylpyrimidine synthase
MRSAWIEKRRGSANVSQMHYARKGVITEEMAHVAKRENLPESLVMEEVARPTSTTLAWSRWRSASPPAAR